MTVTQESGFLDDYLRVERLPHIWCSGCGLGIVLNCYARALLEARVNLDKVVTISGIGCTGRASGYVNTDGFHTTHGRAIPFATGVRIANPDLTPVVISGDGDLLVLFKVRDRTILERVLHRLLDLGTRPAQEPLAIAKALAFGV